MSTNYNRRLFIEALRSGKYKQSHHFLRTDEGYCCLGVACEIYRQQTQHGAWVGNHFLVGKTEADGTLPEDVAAYYGFESNPHLYFLDSPGGRQTATYLNDVAQLSFTEIAKLFEEKYL